MKFNCYSYVYVVSAIIIFAIDGVDGKIGKKANKEGCYKTIRTTRLVRSPRVTSSNRNKPVTCSFHLLKHGFGDFVFELNFKTFHVGVSHNSTWCSNSHLQIVDHPSRLNTSGYFCGKLQHGRSFIAETDHVVIVFHSDSFNRQTNFRFQSSVLPKALALERHKELTLKNAGHLVNGTYCDRNYVNCQPHCDVTSPRFPGFYPRNVTCRYSVVFNQTKNTKIALGGHYYDNFDVWGGPSRCQSHFCLPNDVSTHCPYDYIQIFDVKTTPTIENQRILIAKFCGRGHLPRVVSRSNQIEIEFVSALAGSMNNEGFHLFVGPDTRHDDVTVGNPLKWTQSVDSDGDCHFVFDSSVATQGQLQNLKHWYSPGTRCTYRFIGRKDSHRVFLQFLNFNAQRGDDWPICRSKLTLYDAAGPDANKLSGTYCGKHQPNETYLSTKNDFYIEYDSKIGSYDGSNFEFLILYTFIDTETTGRPIVGTDCDELYDSRSGNKNGLFNFFKNRFRLWKKRHLTCTFQFQGRVTERVKVTITHIRLNPRRPCNSDEKLICSSKDNRSTSTSLDSLSIYDSVDSPIDCLCDSVYVPYAIASTDESLILTVHLSNIPALAYRDIDTYSIKGHYEFLQVGCGDSQLQGSQGQLNFPAIDSSSLPNNIQCKWTIELTEGTNLVIKIYKLFLTGNCTTDYLKMYRKNGGNVEVLCKNNMKSEVVLSWSSDDDDNKVILELNSSSSSARLKLLWSEMTSAKSHMNCDYRCKGGHYCIPNELVCNGVINCPESGSSWDPLDEGIDACTSISVIMQWILLTFCSTFVVALIAALSLIWRQKCVCYHKKSNTNNLQQMSVRQHNSL
ncbi:hypothetical protein CHUAL_011944 [Chamberlinius hualienensis]